MVAALATATGYAEPRRSPPLVHDVVTEGNATAPSTARLEAWTRRHERARRDYDDALQRWTDARDGDRPLRSAELETARMELFRVSDFLGDMLALIRSRPARP